LILPSFPTRRSSDLVIVAATFGCAVTREVFWASGDTVGRIETGSLVTAHIGAGHYLAKIGILAGAFRHSAPARVARDIDHRRKRDRKSTRLNSSHVS